MRVINLNAYGGPEVLVVTEAPMPMPGPDSLLVRVKAAGVNRADILQRKGKYTQPIGESSILGLEIAGIVEKIGENVTKYKIGDSIFGLVGSGAYAEYCLIDQDCALVMPPHLTFIEAAAIPEAFLTATEALFSLGELKPEETILIHAGASGVGTACIQLAKRIGATVFTTTGNSEKALRLKELNPDVIINYKNTIFVDEILTFTKGLGVNVIIDFIGANYLSMNFASLADNGRLIFVGLMGGKTTTIDLGEILTRRLQLKGLIMRTRSLFDKRQMVNHFKNKWLPLFENHSLKPIIDSVFPLERVKEAHEKMENNTNVGKIILEI